ncbi:MAG: ComEC/Rec2 family competence protein, partial [Bacteroidota bacterium]
MGIWLANVVNYFDWLPFAFLFFLIILVFYRVFIQTGTPDYRGRWVTGALLFFIILLLFWNVTGVKRENNLPGNLLAFSNQPQSYIAEIAESVIQKERTTKMVVTVEKVKLSGKWFSTSGKIMLSVKKDDHSRELFYGDHLLFNGKLMDPMEALFPNSYNQKENLRRNSIYYVCYLQSHSWKRISHSCQVSIFGVGLHLRDKLLTVLRENDVTGQEFAVAGALLLGYVDELDPVLLKEYSGTGAMHILSVSGMHVGIIFVVLDKLLSFFMRWKYGGITKTAMIVVMIWFYALLTGLSPAVLRAAVMISFVVIGKSMNRHPDVLNILAASFLFLLFYDPGLLVNIGFQLSYLAVGGIVILYPPIYDLYVTSKKLPDKIWSLLAVSIAAQLITFPLSLYYFHQFPNYFMLTNLIVVPISSMVIYSGILLLCLGSVPIISYGLGRLLVFLVSLLNKSIHFIDGLPL